MLLLLLDNAGTKTRQKNNQNEKERSGWLFPHFFLGNRNQGL